MKRILIVSAALLVVVIIAGVWWVASSLDSIVKNAIEEQGSQALGTAVQVSSVSISLTEGRGTVRGLEVANPEGFSEEHAFTLQEVTLDIDVSSLDGDAVVLDEVRIIAPEIDFEMGKDGKSNIDILRQNLIGAGGQGSSGTDAEMKLLIRQFTLEKGKVNANTVNIGGQRIEAEFPSVEMKDLGGPDGAPPAVIGKQVVDKLTQTVAMAVAKKGLEKMLEKKGGEGVKAVKGLIDKVGK